MHLHGAHHAVICADAIEINGRMQPGQGTLHSQLNMIHEQNTIA